MWTEVPKGKNKKPVNKDRFISKMFLRYPSLLSSFTLRRCWFRCFLFLRGDSVILGELRLSLLKINGAESHGMHSASRSDSKPIKGVCGSNAWLSVALTHDCISRVFPYNIAVCLCDTKPLCIRPCQDRRASVSISLNYSLLLSTSCPCPVLPISSYRLSNKIYVHDILDNQARIPGFCVISLNEII